MTDREKVVNAIECCIDGCLCAECDYEGIEGCWNKVLLTDALALLKEQCELRKTYVEACDDLYAIAKNRVDVVRCKDCKHSIQDSETLFYRCEHPFGLTGMPHGADWFCADGERKEVK